MVIWNVRKIAASKGITTATDLAEQIGVNINTANGLMNGRSVRVDRETLTKLCEGLGCTPGDLLVYEKNETPAGFGVAYATV